VKTLAAIHTNNIFSTIQNLATGITSYTYNTNKLWPYVVVPDFPARAAQIHELGGANYVALSMIVSMAGNDSTTNAKFEWERFANENHQGWITEGLEWEGSNETATTRITPVIFSTNSDGEFEPDDGDQPFYLPTWQTAPVIVPYVNFNPMNSYVDPADIVHIETKRHGTLLEGFGESIILHPVFERVDREDGLIRNPDHDHTDDHDHNAMVGTLSAGIPWTYYFESILPDGTPPIHAVLKDTCGRLTYTYEINGDHVTRISDSEDLHDPKYNYLRVEGSLHHEDLTANFEAEKEDDHGTEGDGMEDHDGVEEEPDQTLENDDVDHMNYEGDMEGREHTGHENECLFTYSLYPTEEFEDSYNNNFPIYAMLGVVLIFILTSLIFILYDVLVARRFRRVEESATRSNAIVSSLFPAQVRDRLMETAADDGGKNGRGGAAIDMMSPKLMTPHLFGVTGNRADSKSAPIADLFPSATVMFADIASFTAWSSVREPTQVFMLLEEIYNSFDSIAKRRRVFKVETIGDSYGALLLLLLLTVLSSSAFSDETGLTLPINLIAFLSSLTCSRCCRTS
jgi:Adenylate and Guanylate cyclase catalytic domain